MGDKVITQNESKIVVQWLREEHNADIPNKLEFWNLKPIRVVDQLKSKWKVEVTVEEILRAARRID